MSSSIEIKSDIKRLKKIEKPVTAYRQFFTEDNLALKAAMLLRHQFRSFYFIEPPMWRVNLRKFGLKQRVAPDFCSTGAVRSGTSTLSNYIFQHPCVVLPLAKELSMLRWEKDHLRQQFPKQAEMDLTRKKYGTAITGHASPFSPSSTMVYFNKQLNPDLKTIITLRNPVERVISHWRWDLMKSKNLRNNPLWQDMPGFEESIRIEMRDIVEGGCGFQLFSGSGGTSYLRHSIYLPYIELCMKEMGKNNVCVINANDFFREPMQTTAKVYDFLGLPKYKPFQVKEINPSPPLDVSDEIKQELTEFFQPYNQQLYDFLGVDFNW